MESDIAISTNVNVKFVERLLITEKKFVNYQIAFKEGVPGDLRHS